MRKIMAVLILTFLGGLTQARSFEWEYPVNDWGTFIVPFRHLNTVYLYDFVGKENLVAGETPFFRFDKYAEGLTLTVGAVGDFSDENAGELRGRTRRFLESGTPFIGGHFDVSLIENRWFVGAHIGRNLEEGVNIAGVKSSLRIY